MKVLISLIFILLMAGCADAKEPSLTEIQVKGGLLFLKGTFDKNTNHLVKDALTAHPEIKTLVFTDNGGSINDDATLSLGRFIRKKGLNTHIASEGRIASGGVSLFLSGAKRSKGENVKIGVHSWQHCQGSGKAQKCKDANEHSKNDKGHDLHKDYIEEMLGSDDFYWFSINAAPSDDIYWLSGENIKKYQLTNHKYDLLISETSD